MEARPEDCNVAGMATQQNYLDLPVDLPKRRTPWFVWMMGAFALLVMATLIYTFLRVLVAPMPKLELPQQDTPSEWPHPASRPR